MPGIFQTSLWAVVALRAHLHLLAMSGIFSCAWEPDRPKKYFLSFNMPRFSLPLAVLSLLALAASLPAQDAADPYREFQVTAAPSATFESTPEVKGPSGKTTQRRTKWMMIEVPINWAPTARQDEAGNPIAPFVEELEMEIYALLAAQPVPFQAVLLKGNVKLLNIQADQRNTRAALFVSPRLLERLFDGKAPSTAASALLGRDAIGVVLKHKGQTVATWPESEPFFWSDLAVAGLSPDQVLTIDKAILPRWKTPFAFSNWDFYEEEAIEL